MTSGKKIVSIKNLLVIIFALFMLAALIAYGLLVHRNWLKSTGKMIESMASDTNEHLVAEIDSFLHVPYHINEMNRLAIENNILDIANEEQRDKFFVGALTVHPESIYSFSYGMESGEYYGARRNENGDIEIMRNNTATGGQSWYYSVGDDMTAGDLAVKAGLFDPRTRDWYQAAAAVKGPVFSQVYRHFIKEDLTISAAWPIYDESGSLEGVMGSHLLLSDINQYLEQAVERYSGYAVITEQDSGYIIANSLGLDSFKRLSDDSLVRQDLNDLQNADIVAAFRQYETDRTSQFRYKGTQETLYVTVEKIKMSGIDWLLLSAIPESLFMSDITSRMVLTVVLAVFILLVLLLAFMFMIKRLLKPLRELHEAASAFISGNLSKRVKIYRHDEVGLISESFNDVTSKMQALIENLDENIRVRTKELHQANHELDESRQELRLILDSAAEAVYGIDNQGRCTFCNASGIKMLGYHSEQELIGQDMHQLIHHSKSDGTPFPVDSCKISQAILLGKGFQSDDEVFWRADGTPFVVEYRAYPQIKDGIVVGGVVTFADITERKKNEEEIKYLNQHDPLTGLLNRRYFERALSDLDVEENLPLSTIFADVNGLKLTNDIFGHAAGDALIKKTADILTRSCREKDIIARIGGDEFVILLPNTHEENARHVLARIQSETSAARMDAVKCSIALGIDTKMNPGQSLQDTMANAENEMYRDKTINRKQVNKDLIDTIIDTLHTKNPRERQHAVIVRELCGQMGVALSLSQPEIDRLMRAAYLHDIGKVALSDDILTKDAYTDEEDHLHVQQHALIGYRLLSLIDDSMDLSEYVYNHHEYWDGTGFPRGIKGEQIPLISRIISVVETYERALNRSANLRTHTEQERKQLAVSVIQKGAGTRFDPEIAELFIQMVMNADSTA